MVARLTGGVGKDEFIMDVLGVVGVPAEAVTKLAAVVGVGTTELLLLNNPGFGESGWIAKMLLIFKGEVGTVI